MYAAWSPPKYARLDPVLNVTIVGEPDLTLTTTGFPTTLERVRTFCLSR